MPRQSQHGRAVEKTRQGRLARFDRYPVEQQAALCPQAACHVVALPCRAAARRKHKVARGCSGAQRLRKRRWVVRHDAPIDRFAPCQAHRARKQRTVRFKDLGLFPNGACGHQFVPRRKDGNAGLIIDPNACHAPRRQYAQFPCAQDASLFQKQLARPAVAARLQNVCALRDAAFSKDETVVRPAAVFKHQHRVGALWQHGACGNVGALALPK